jgi:hypothetical protein
MKTLEELLMEAACLAHLENGYNGVSGLYPDWVYHACSDREHREKNIPWLNDLLAALGWQGGTIHDALNCVRRLVAESKRKEVQR